MYHGEVSRRSILQTPVHPNSSLCRCWGYNDARFEHSEQQWLTHVAISGKKGPHGNEHGTVFTTTALHPYISPLSRQKKARRTITKPNKQAAMCFRFKLQQLSCVMTRHDVTPNNSSNKTLHYITSILPSITLLKYLSFTLWLSLLPHTNIA
jgi:hypothetical protein